jgi:hypothetical protein
VAVFRFVAIPDRYDVAKASGQFDLIAFMAASAQPVAISNTRFLRFSNYEMERGDEITRTLSPGEYEVRWFFEAQVGDTITVVITSPDIGDFSINLLKQATETGSFLLLDDYSNPPSFEKINDNVYALENYPLQRAAVSNRYAIAITLRTRVTITYRIAFR